MRLLFLGDIVGKPGRQMVMDHLPRLRRELRLDVVMANGENASGGVGLSIKNAQELRRGGVDLLSGGNHIWKFRDLHPLLDTEGWIVRPGNYPFGAPGQGAVRMEVHGTGLWLINLQGRTFMEPVDCPFAVAERLIDGIPDQDIVVVDFHAEATSEKRAMLHLLRGRVHAVLGTHTHVQTNDACIVDSFTGYITDLGMCGPVDSCLGMDNDIILRKFRTGLPQRFELAKGSSMLNGVVLELDKGGCRSISAWKWMLNEQEVS